VFSEKKELCAMARSEYPFFLYREKRERLSVPTHYLLAKSTELRWRDSRRGKKVCSPRRLAQALERRVVAA